MTSIQDVIRAAIPGAPKDLCEFILWERTSYPFGRLTAQKIFKAASGFARAGANGRALCEMCRRLSVPQKFLCERCQSALDNAQEAQS